MFIAHPTTTTEACKNPERSSIVATDSTFSWMKSGATTAGIILQVLVGYFVYPTAVASGDSQPAINKNSVDVAHTSSAGFLATGRAAVRVEEATAAAAAAAEQTPSTAGMLELSGTLNSGHHISISMPRTATEEEVRSRLVCVCLRVLYSTIGRRGIQKFDAATRRKHSLYRLYTEYHR